MMELTDGQTVNDTIFNEAVQRNKEFLARLEKAKLRILPFTGHERRE